MFEPRHTRPAARYRDTRDETGGKNGREKRAGENEREKWAGENEREKWVGKMGGKKGREGKESGTHCFLTLESFLLQKTIEKALNQSI